MKVGKSETLELINDKEKNECCDETPIIGEVDRSEKEEVGKMIELE